MPVMKKWLKRIHQTLHLHLKNASFNNEDLAEALGISKRHLFRQMKTLTGMSPRQYIRWYRLQQAKQLIEAGKYTTVKDISFAVGYKHVGYFIIQFEKEFGKKPLDMLREHGWR